MDDASVAAPLTVSGPAPSAASLPTTRPPALMRVAPCEFVPVSVRTPAPFFTSAEPPDSAPDKVRAAGFDSVRSAFSTMLLARLVALPACRADAP
ncbi:hypothetical protein D3C72_1530860 [compost metagenome]